MRTKPTPPTVGLDFHLHRGMLGGRQIQVGRAMAGVGVQKISYTHDAMIDMIIAEPGVSQGELARRFGYTQPWVSTLMSSDAFQAQLARRRAETVDPILVATVEERTRAMTLRSLEVLQEKLAAPSQSIPDNLALKAMELGAKAMGMGGNAPPQAPSLPADHLDKLANRLIDLQSKVIQGECVREDQVEKS